MKLRPSKNKGRRCPRCKGEGKIYYPGMRSTFFAPRLEGWSKRCDLCGGTGKIQ